MSQRVALLAVVVAIGGLTVGVPSPVGAAPATIAPRTGRGSKLSPRLATLAAETGFASPRAEARALSVPASGFGSLVRRPNGRVLVYVRTVDTSSDGVAELQARGAQIVDVSPRYSTVTAAVAPDALQSLAADPAVEYVMEVLAPHVGAAPPARVQTGATASPAACAPIISEGDNAMNVATARSANHVNGSGETIGILSDSFAAATGTATTAAQDVADGDLPGPANPCGHSDPVKVLADDGGPSVTDEGRAMVQLTHDLAPGADLAFATADNGEDAFANEIDALRTQAHASVLADDVFYANEPFFQDGPIATAARGAVAAGVPYFTAAGNANVIVGGKNVVPYEAPAYRPGICPAMQPLDETLVDCHNFDSTGMTTGTSDAITVQPGGGFDLDLQWAQPRGGVTSDFDAFVIDSNNIIRAESELNNPVAGQPFEFLGWGNTGSVPQTVRVVIGRYSGGAAPRLKFVLVDSAGVTGVQYDTSANSDVVGPGIIGHSGTAGIGTTAAIPFDDATSPEDYSSRGPATHYFQPVPSTTALGSPEVIDAPAFAATDGVRTSFFAQQIGGVWRFYGTSAAAPQAAAIGAVLRSKNPLLTPAQVLTAMHDTARTVATNGTPDAVGGGYLDANAALASVSAIAGAPTGVTGTPGDSQATVHWTAPASDGGIPVSGYTVTPAINGVAQTPQTFPSAGTSETITGLANGTAYTFTVTANDANGPGPESDPSAPVNVGAPTKPTGVAVTAGGDSRVTLKWTTPASTNGATITGYTIRPFRVGIALPPRSVGVANTATITGLVNGYAHTFQVSATNTRGDGERSDATPPFTVGLPGAPSRVVAKPANGAAVVSFKAPTTGNVHVSSYTIQAFEESTLFATVSFSNATTQTFTGLNNAFTYKFRVKAVTNGGGGPYSPFSQPIVAGAPTAPGAPRITPGNGSAVLHWTTAAANGSPIKKFVVTPIVNGVAKPARTYSTGTTSATITGLPNAKTFAFGIKATNSRGTGPQAIAPTVIVGAPTAPSKVTAKPGKGRATVHWLAPNANGSAITGYTITPYHHGSKLAPQVFKSTATQQTITGLTAGSGWTFVVAATNGRGTGPASSASKSVVIS